MAQFEEEATQKLFDKKLISEEQFVQVKAYRSLGIFSLHNELKLFLYLSVLLFTTGIGILIYQNIDTIGHIAILSLLLIVTVVCFYFCFKNSKGFQRGESSFENPVLQYLVLAATILSCIFVGYIQFQYELFGAHYGLATLVPTIISFFCAYYFDNKSVLTIAVTGLAAYIGLSVSPQTLLNNNFYTTDTLSYSAIILGGLLIVWTIYSTRINLKTHFNFIYLTYALHLISIAVINNLYQDYWLIFMIVLGASTYYFYKISYQIPAISLFVFTIIYAYIGINIVVFKFLEFIDASDFYEVVVFLAPFYVIGSIILFIKLIKNFNKQKANDSIR
ncbi:DUF2157 domain-containing protein [Flavobacterium branchiarum]|uniref:DUF2157 domain-containing protein n=1 Tax=Flavobacterium branchiarum TaxID=1114870 RepID=A0ABV5FHY3_9FLAO|nr:DUF2157 domain-containing protein [Flavobacterium branchiarum]MDN3673694.1 DUF2157 domain-containing protein [Flavobacterium branchiarum]